MTASGNSENKGAIPFFSKYCSEEWIPLIRQHQQIFHVAKEQAFIREGEKVSGIFVLSKGKAKVMSHSMRRRGHILRLVNAPMIVGHRGLFSKNYNISAVALTPCEITFIPMNLFLQLFKTNIAFSMFMLEFLTEELNDSDEQQYVLTLDNVRQRIAYCLLRLIRIFGYEKAGDPQLAFTLSRRDIASMANTTYESVIRTLSAFEKEKLVGTNGKTLLVLNEVKLREIATGL